MQGSAYGVRATDLRPLDTLTDATWAEMQARFTDNSAWPPSSPPVSTRKVSMFLNTFGVQLDPGQTLDPDLKAF